MRSPVGLGSSLELSAFTMSLSPPQCVRVLLCFIKQIFGESLRSRVHSLNQGTWGGRILTLHLNYVAGCTGPLLFLFERTHNYYVDNEGLVPWQLVWTVCVSYVLLCFVDPILGKSSVCVCVALRVEFLLKTESGYLRDAGVTWFTLANP